MYRHGLKSYGASYTQLGLRMGKWSLGLRPFDLKQLVTWPNFFKLSVSGIGHLAQSHLT